MVAHRTTAGFTFVEILIVVLILGIVSALAIPMLSSHRVERLRQAARLIIADIGYAQIESMAHPDDPRLIQLNTETNTYHIATASTPDTPVDNPHDKQPYVVTFGQRRAQALEGITITSHNVGDDNTLQFGMYGQLDQTADATITLAIDDNQLTITIDAISGEASTADIEQASSQQSPPPNSRLPLSKQSPQKVSKSTAAVRLKSTAVRTRSTRDKAD